MIEDLALSDRRRQQRAKNWTLLAVLVALVALFYAITLVRIGGWQ